MYSIHTYKPLICLASLWAIELHFLLEWEKLILLKMFVIFFKKKKTFVYDLVLAIRRPKDAKDSSSLFKTSIKGKSHMIIFNHIGGIIQYA